MSTWWASTWATTSFPTSNRRASRHRKDSAKNYLFLKRYKVFYQIRFRIIERTYRRDPHFVNCRLIWPPPFNSSTDCHPKKLLCFDLIVINFIRECYDQYSVTNFCTTIQKYRVVAIYQNISLESLHRKNWSFCLSPQTKLKTSPFRWV